MFSKLSTLIKCTNSTRDLLNHTKRWKSSLKHIDKLLIANRGEIACRIMKTAKRLGVRTVAVYSDADANSLHVSLADEAFCIGPAPATQSYLKADVLLEIAKKSGAQAIHPGYGFLSENVEFAENCQKNNIIFIGPPSSAIRDMGIKSTSKAIMSKAGVPIIEGYHGEDQTNQTLQTEASRIGFPIMIKAVRGGGGKGMRIALSAQDFEEALESARTEAQKSFGDSVVLLEKFVAEPRHVEVQVFADSHGNAVHLYERDCSVQRRHQKIIEEAPAPGLSEDLRKELGAAAVKAAKAVGYVGAGTVEFILDKNSHSFHFMEMNTRLQVEHPITEMITGADLVEWQIKIAAGEELKVKQDEIPLKGHSFEARIYAEDPSGGFLPGAGPLLHLATPRASEDVRIETGVRSGDEVSVHYDPMIAKLVVWGVDRMEALTKLQSKLLEYNIAGLETNVNFLLDLARHPEFVKGNVHTNFIKDHHSSLFKDEGPSETQLVQAGLAVALLDESQKFVDAKEDAFNPFCVEAGFRINYQQLRTINLNFKDNVFAVKIIYLSANQFKISTNDGKTWNKVSGALSANQLNCDIDGAKSKVNIFANQEFLSIFDQNGKIQFALDQEKFQTEEDESSTASSVMTPMPGILDKIMVKVGDAVEKGDPLFVLIAMKMEHIVKANRDGRISNVLHNVGDNVLKDTTVVQFEEE